ncbi:uncharacterized protein [Rutidosis leptorrhynchoides]|uniref:uncharacterized protein n=1 Tax=Rutidosis leptorrhynchoides TaxID=125765 RepID=UPI003A99E3C8
MGGRYILDGVLIANETVEALKRNKTHGLIFKVDFEKAFDSLNWNYLLDVMKCMGGVRQGDPLSPFLFIIAAEGINILTKLAVNRGLYKGVEIGSDNVTISHLQYADDTIFFGEWSRRNARNLMYLLECFERASDLRVNYHKSQLYGVGVSKAEVESMSTWCKCQPGSLPFVYLGLPVGAKMKKFDDWIPVVNKFGKRLADWRARSVSFGGRLTLVKSVLSRNDVDSLGVPFSGSFNKVIGNGSDTLFWEEVWCGGSRLRDQFQRLYRLESNFAATVADRVQILNSAATESWAWLRMPTGRTEGELQDLSALIEGYNFKVGERDKWTWTLGSNGTYTVQDLSVLIDGKLLVGEGSNVATIRNHLVPLKVELFIWRARLGRLPVRTELDKRGIDLHSSRCPICDGGLETVEHILFCVIGPLVCGEKYLCGGDVTVLR